MQPLATNATENNCCQFNPVHELFSCGSKEGCVEAWDPRSRSRAGVLDCAPHVLTESSFVKGVPAVTSLRYRKI